MTTTRDKRQCKFIRRMIGKALKIGNPRHTMRVEVACEYMVLLCTEIEYTKAAEEAEMIVRDSLQYELQEQQLVELGVLR